MQNYEEPLFLISVVAKVLSIHPQTLRQYEREGLVEPSRTDGKMRLYSQKDVDRVKTILNLTRDVILQLKEKIDDLEATIDDLNKKLHEATSQTSTKRSLVKRKSSFDLVFYEGKK